MATPLHDVEALRALAEGEPGLAQDWAARRLAILQPEAYTRAPTGEDTFDEVCAANPPELVSSIVRALRANTPCSPSLAASVASLGAYGILPEDTEELEAAIRGAIVGDGTEADLWLAQGLAILHAVKPADLSAAARVNGPSRAWLLPAVVLRAAEGVGALSDAAPEVASVLLRSEDDGSALVGILAALGTPTGPDTSKCREPEDAAELGLRAAGSDARVYRRQGSMRNRLQALVVETLANVPGPAAALLRALYKDGADMKWGFGPVSVAMWLAHFQPSDPVQDVLHHLGGADPHRLTTARAAIRRSEHKPDLIRALQSEGRATSAILSLPLITGGDHELAYLTLMLRGRSSDIRVDAAAAVAAWQYRDSIPSFVLRRSSRELGLTVAPWVPTQEVLQALLEQEVPTTDGLRARYAYALAAMGDPAVTSKLASFVHDDPTGTLAPAKALAEALLGTPLPVA